MFALKGCLEYRTIPCQAPGFWLFRLKRLEPKEEYGFDESLVSFEGMGNRIMPFGSGETEIVGRLTETIDNLGLAENTILKAICPRVQPDLFLGASDPGETTNLVFDYPEKADSMRSKIMKWRKTL